MVWYGVMWLGVVLCGVVWCHVVGCSVMWCSVVWCGVVIKMWLDGSPPDRLPVLEGGQQERWLRGGSRAAQYKLLK